MTNHSAIRLVVITITLTMTLAHHTAWAACLPDASLEKKQLNIAQRSFPTLLPALPEILGCDAVADLPSALGDFSADHWRVRILMQHDFIPVEIVIAHELGHALAFKHGETHGRYRGHGSIWMRTMIRAGYGSEAYRTASLTHHYPGLLSVYQTVSQREIKRRLQVPEIDVLALLNERPGWLDFLMRPID